MKQRGFTIIELMLVVAILGITTALILPIYQKHSKCGKITNQEAKRICIAKVTRTTYVEEVKKMYRINCDNGKEYEATYYSFQGQGIQWTDERGDSHALMGMKCEVTQL